MKKYLFVLLFLALHLFGQTFHFTELRYSDALGKSMELKGEISLKANALSIRYNGSSRLIEYDDGDLEISEDGEPLALGEEEVLKLSEYFELVLLLFHADEKTLANNFNITQEANKQTLTPLTQLKEYVQKIELQKEQGSLKVLHIYLSNDDNIKISIEDEVR
jgi:hypothetical protein